jgi:mycothiol synthase
MVTPTINPAPPLLPGLIWRAITRDDLMVLVELETECHLVDGGLVFMNEPGNLSDRYFPETAGALIGAFTGDGWLAACASVHLVGEPDPPRATIVGQVRPEWRDRGIGAYLMCWSGVQARSLCAAATADHCLLQIATESLTEAARRLYRAHGFRPVMEELVMRRVLQLPLPDRPVPPEVTITSWQPDLSVHFFEAYEASFRERPGFPGWSAAEWIAWSFEDDNAKPEWSLLARMGGVPVGFLTAGTEHPGGFVVQIGVIPGQRRRGLASGLMVEAMRRMREAGETETQLTVNINNPGAIKTYQQLGFETVGRRARYEQVVE